MSRNRLHIPFAIVGLVMLLLSVSSCVWRDLDYDYVNSAKFTLVFKWDESSLAYNAGKSIVDVVRPGDPINGRTAVFFPMDGGAPVVRMSHSDTMRVNLPVMEYYAVFFNETYDDFDNIMFSGTGSFESLLASAKDDDGGATKTYSRIVSEPDMLAVTGIVPFSVTEEMVFYSRILEARNTKADVKKYGLTDFDKVEESMTVVVHPHDVVYPLDVELTVEGLNNVVSSGVYISGFSGGYDFSAASPDTEMVTYKVSLNNKSTFDEAGTEGVLEGQTFVFGQISGQTSYQMEFRALLIDGSVYSETRDISGLVVEESNDGRLMIKIEVGLGTGEGSDNPPIHVPDVKKIDTGGGWQVEVGDWDEVIVPVGL